MFRSRPGQGRGITHIGLAGLAAGGLAAAGLIATNIGSSEFHVVQTGDGLTCGIVAAGEVDDDSTWRKLSDKSMAEGDACRYVADVKDCPLTARLTRDFCSKTMQAQLDRVLALPASAPAPDSMRAAPGWMTQARALASDAIEEASRRAGAAWYLLRNLESVSKVVDIVDILMDRGRQVPDGSEVHDAGSLFPHAVNFWHGDLRPVCGGTLLEDGSLVTAAHCPLHKMKLRCNSREFDLDCKRHKKAHEGGCGTSAEKCAYDVATCTALKPLQCGGGGAKRLKSADLSGAGIDTAVIFGNGAPDFGFSALAFKLPAPDLTSATCSEPLTTLAIGTSNGPSTTRRDSGHAAYAKLNGEYVVAGVNSFSVGYRSHVARFYCLP